MEVQQFGPRIIIKTLRPWRSFREYLGYCKYRFDLGEVRLGLRRFIFPATRPRDPQLLPNSFPLYFYKT